MTKRLLSVLLACLLLMMGSSALAEYQVPDFGAFEEPVTILRTGYVSDQVRQNTLRDEYTYESNPWIDAYKKYLNVDVKYLFLTSSSEEFNTKTSLALASGDIPDYMTVDLNQLKQLVEADVIYGDVRELYDQYAGDTLKHYMSALGDTPWDISTIDGVCYGIPQNGGNDYDTMDFMWIRSDWLKNLGMEIPTNYEELVEVIKAFTFKDPDGNGQNDTYGLALSNELTNVTLQYEGIFEMFGAYMNSWVEQDGKLVFSTVTENTKNALKFLSDLYKEGCIDPEFGVKNVEAVAQDIAANKIGVVAACNWAPLSTTLNSAIQANENANFICVPISRLSAIGEEVAKSACEPTANQFYVISKSCEHPEAIVKMISLFAELYTNDYATYGITDDGREMWHLAGMSSLPYKTKNNDNMVYGGKYLRGEVTAEEISAEQLKMAENVKLYQEGDRSMWSYYAIFADDGENNSSEFHISDGVADPAKYYYNNAYTGETTQGMVDYKSMLDGIRDEAFIKIIIGDQPIEYFDTFVNDWMAAGGQTITDEVNAWYAAK
jgi:putative aldouronate transport system substrate-binding protein